MRANFFNKRAQLVQIHIAFERVRVFWVVSFVDYQVAGAAAAGADISFCCVKVHIGGDVHSRLDQEIGENILRSAALVSGNEMLEAKYLLHDLS